MEIHAFYNAAFWRNFDKIQALLKKPPEYIQHSINRLGPDGRTPLCVAAENNDEAILEALLSYSNIEPNRGKDGRIPLYAAARAGHKKIVRLLLMHPGIHVNDTTRAGRTPLYIAVVHNHIEVVKLLLTHPQVDINQGVNEYIPLYAAARYNHPSIMKLLLLHGAAINAVLIEYCNRKCYSMVNSTKRHLTEAFSAMFGLSLTPFEQEKISWLLVYLMRQPHRQWLSMLLDEEAHPENQLPSIGEALCPLKEREIADYLILECNLREEIIQIISVVVSFYRPQLMLFWKRCLAHDWITPFPLEQLPSIDWDRLCVRKEVYPKDPVPSIRPYSN